MPESTATSVIEILVIGSVLGEQTVNRWFYGLPVTPVDTLDDFLTEFGNTVLSDLLVTMSSQSSFDTGFAQYVKGGTAFATKTYSASGTTSGDCLPPFVAWDFTLLRSGARERNGYKRIAGVPESSQANGNPTSGARANLDVAAASMAGNITLATDEWIPVIRRKRIGKVIQNPPKYYDISTVQFSRIGSQNSRKSGHGR
jgi:hypothetical protein